MCSLLLFPHLLLSLIFLMMLNSISLAETINIPDNYTTIQAGIDAASDGDTVLVAPRTYTENIEINGKNIVVGSHFITTQDTTYISHTIVQAKEKESEVIRFSNGVLIILYC